MERLRASLAGRHRYSRRYMCALVSLPGKWGQLAAVADVAGAVVRNGIYANVVRRSRQYLAHQHQTRRRRRRASRHTCCSHNARVLRVAQRAVSFSHACAAAVATHLTTVSVRLVFFVWFCAFVYVGKVLLQPTKLDTVQSDRQSVATSFTFAQRL